MARYPARWQFPLWDVCFDGATEDDGAGTSAGASASDASGEKEEEIRGPTWFWGSVYPQVNPEP